MFAQVPTPTGPELTSWIIGGAAVLTMASLIRSFIRKPPLEAEFVSKSELEKIKSELREEITECRTQVTDLNTRTSRLEGLLTVAPGVWPARERPARRPFRKFLAFILLPSAFLLAGCAGLLPAKRTESASLKSAEAIATTQNLTVERVAHALSLAPEPFRITSSTEQSARSKEAASGRYKISLPLGVTLGLAGVGLIALAWGIRAIRRSSAAANTAFQVLDSSLATGIRLLRNAATTSTNHSEISAFQTVIAALEVERGKAVRNH